MTSVRSGSMKVDVGVDVGVPREQDTALDAHIGPDVLGDRWGRDCSRRDGREKIITHLDEILLG